MTSDPAEDDDDEIPLDIVGHGDREAPEESKTTKGASERSSGVLASEASQSSGDEHSESAGERSDPRDRDHPSDAAADDVLAAESNTPAVSDDSAASADGEDAEAEDRAVESLDEVPDDLDADADDDGGDEEIEPIELLVQLAKDGEIDPWDIDVVEVTEEFLAALEYGDLRQSGRALFYASVLVRMKSDVLLEEPQEEHVEDEPWDAPMEVPEDAPPAFDPVDSLEDEMERRLQRKHVRGTPETLDELVRELREAERDSWWKESREYDTSESPAGFDRGTQTLDYHDADDRRMDGEPTAQEVTARTHGEDIEEVIDEVRAAIVEHYEAGRPEVLFREVEDAGGSRVQTYLAILFLANRGTVRLQQDELFGDLWIQDPTAELGAEGALA